MNSKIVLAIALLAAIVCVALAQNTASSLDDLSSSNQAVRQQTNPADCPVRRTLNSITRALSSLSQQARQQISRMQARGELT